MVLRFWCAALLAEFAMRKGIEGFEMQVVVVFADMMKWWYIGDCVCRHDEVVELVAIGV